MRFWVSLLVVVCLLLGAGGLYVSLRHDTSFPAPAAPAYAIGTTTAANLPPEVMLNNNYWAPQTFNNCGPAALSMDLSFYGVQASQETLADALRPDHNTTGHDDEKSTTPDAIAAEAQTFGLVAYYRPAGTLTEVKQLLAAGFPVMVRTLFMPTDQVAHYRVLIGYNDAAQQIIDEDGYQGPHVTYSYNDFLQLWKYYNYDYIVLAPPAKQSQVEAILGSATDAKTAWQTAAANAQADLTQNPADFLATFNLAVANYYLSNYAKTVAGYESVAAQLPPDTLWYQIEPIEAYYQLGNYKEVFLLTDAIINDNNPAVPELYMLRGQSYLKEGDTIDAKAQFELALQYNKNLESAKDALANL